MRIESMKTINKASQIYEFIKDLISKSVQKGHNQLAQELDSDMHLGGSGLEILGAIRKTLLYRNDEISNIIEKDEFSLVKEVVDFVDKAYGRPLK
jgi:methyl coenzyme M reductase gamma subunit